MKDPLAGLTASGLGRGLGSGPRRPLPPPVALAVLVIVAALSVATWWVFLGQDTTYQRDPVTGAASGPYEAPQIIACAAVLIALAVVGAILLPGLAVVLAVAGSFTLAWFIDAQQKDSSGLSGVGGLMLLVGSAGGLGLVVWAMHGVRLTIRRFRPATP